MKPETGLDIARNRSAGKYSVPEMTRRVLWGAGKILFRFTPRTFFAGRRFLLRLFGARIGKQVHVYNTALIYMPWNLEVGEWSSIGEQAYVYNLGRITIGNKVTISHRAHLCAGSHDYEKPDLPLLKPSIRIGDQAWVCADAFVGPGVTVGEGAVVGARAVVVKKVEAWTVVAGNPAKPVRRRIMRQTPSAT